MPEHRPLVGVALSGGGARGFAHIGVLRVLEREKIPIDFLAGTSMGGVIAAGFASGMNSYDLEREAFTATRKWRLLRLVDPSLRCGGVIRGKRLMAYFEQQFSEKTFSDLRIPLGLVAANLNSGKQVVLREGPLALAVRATTSVPGLFTPVEVNGQRLVDGGVLNNLPVDVAMAMGAEVVIAVDISLASQVGTGHWISAQPWVPSGIAQTIGILADTLYTIRATSQENQFHQYPPNVLICPDLPKNINTIVGYGRVPELVTVGEQAAENHLPEIRELLRPLWSMQASHRRIFSEVNQFPAAQTLNTNPTRQGSNG